MDASSSVRSSDSAESEEPGGFNIASIKAGSIDPEPHEEPDEEPHPVPHPD